MKAGSVTLIATLLLLAQQAAAQNPVVWSGGITVDERAQAPATGTKLVFFDDTGDFLANVHVIIKDTQGTVVVDTVSPGPWLIVDLPAGSYNARAEVGEKAQGVAIVIGTEGKPEYGFRFPN
jgi:hypothetical protein